jgi:hypothetical protein
MLACLFDIGVASPGYAATRLTDWIEARTMTAVTRLRFYCEDALLPSGTNYWSYSQ